MIPIRTSLTPKHPPYANYLLIAVNCILFLLSYGPYITTVDNQRIQESLRSWAQPFMLNPDHPYIWQFVTYAFLHGGWMHIIGNMYFLFMFGNNVNDRLGNVGYLCFYLAGAVFSGIGHSLLHSTPVLGASGAVAAVTGAYLVLFPNTIITVLFMFFYFFDTFEIRALYFILFKLIFWDNIFEPKFSSQAIAYDAHLAGYFFGVLCVLALVGIRVVDSGDTNLWSMIRQWNRRRVYREVVADGYSPYNASRLRKPVEATISNTPTQDQESPEITDLHQQIASAISYKNTPQAAKLYLELLKLDKHHTLGRQHQLDIANQLMSDSDWPSAAISYENFLSHYGSYEHIEQVQLMLGLLYTRYIFKPERAKELLQIARLKLTQPEQVKMCEDLLSETGR